MDQYTVTGMSCAACQARVEKAVARVDGVTSCSVSLLTNSMGVEGTASPAQIIQAVENAGYGASLKDGEQAQSGSLSAKIAAEQDALKDRTTPQLRRRLIASAGFLLVLMYFSMGHMMWGWPLPHFFDDNHVAMGLAQLLLAGIIMVINQKFFISGFRSLFHGAPNMDTLIALGSSAAFLYSTAMLFAMTRAQADGNAEAVMGYMMEFYFESAAMILTLITVGKMLEAYSKGKTTSALRDLMDLAPKNAKVIRDGQEVTVPVDAVRKGDIFMVYPGESIPVDGIVLDGSSAVDESALTGESIPVDKAAGDAVSSASMNQSGFLKCEATRVGEDTSLAQIISMVSDAAATKAPVAKLADTISGYFVPAVIAIAVLTTVIWLQVGQTAGFALARGICVLVVSCPCALGLATPVAIMVGNGVGAKNGILFKNAEALQETGNVEIIALDKTGTITRGQPQVTDVLPAQGVTAQQLLEDALSLEKRSEHPLAKAIIRYGEENAVSGSEVQDFTALPGNGLEAVLGGKKLQGGKYDYIQSFCTVPDEMQQKARALAEQGKTPLYFVRDGRFLGIIAVADTMKEDSAQAIAQLRALGLRVVMLTGDNERTARAIGAQAGVDEVIAGVLPDGKDEVIRSLMQQGKTAMVGDGINDAPALTRADIGIAIGAGTDVAIDAADVVLMKSRLTDVAAAVRLSRQTYRNIVENLFWALIYNTLLIPLAAGAYVHAFGLTMDPMLGAAAMSLSSFCVVTNALRLNLFKLYDTSKDRPRKKKRGVVEKNKNTQNVQNDQIKESPVQNQILKQTQNKAASEAPDQAHNKAVSEAPNQEQKFNYTKNQTQGGETTMTKTMQIEGMMCGHCEANVKKALEALDGVQSAEVSHTEGTAVVTLSAEVADDVLKEAVEAKDYKVIEIL